MSNPRSYSVHSFFDAVAKGDYVLVRYLLDRHDLEAVDDHGSTALFCACKNRRYRIAELLLDSGASVDTRCGDVGETALHAAAQYGNEATVALLLSRGADVRDVNKYGDTALHFAAIKGSEANVATLLSEGADVRAVNKDGETALHIAASVGSENKVNLLLSYGSIADCVNKFSFTALSCACLYGKSEIANMLIRSGADIHWVCASVTNMVGYTLLHVAAKGDLGNTFQLLLDLKAADVNAVGIDGRTALHLACYHSNINAARYLLKYGAQVNYACRKSGVTALHCAAQRQSLEIVQLLQKYDADVNAEDNEGKTPWNIALGDIRNTEMIQFFVRLLVKMKEQNLFLSESNVKVLSENDQMKDFRVSCEDEIRRMRVSWIGDSNVKMHDILTKGVNRLSDYVSNESVELVLESESYKAEFPVYASDVHDKFLQGRERRELLRQSSDWLWIAINEFYEISYILVEKINRYLTNDDLALQISQEEPEVSPILLS